MATGRFLVRGSCNMETLYRLIFNPITHLLEEKRMLGRRNKNLPPGPPNLDSSDCQSELMSLNYSFDKAKVKKKEAQRLLFNICQNSI